MIRILNSSFKTTSVITEETSFLYNSKFADVGNFEFSVPCEKVAAIPQDGAFCHFSEGDVYGIIRYISVDGKYLTVKGYDLKGLLKQRVVHPGEWTGTPEQIIRTIVTENTGGTRAFPLFKIISTSLTSDSVLYKLESSKQLDTVVSELCDIYGLGYTITYDGTNINFRVVQGTKKKGITFSDAFGSFTDYSYTSDGLTAANVCYNRAVPSGMSVSVNVTTNQNGRPSAGHIFVDKGIVFFEDGDSLAITDKYDFGDGETWDDNHHWTVYAYKRKDGTAKGLGRDGTLNSTLYANNYVVILGRILIGNYTVDVEQWERPTVITSIFSGTEPNGFERVELAGNESATAEENSAVCIDKIDENGKKESLNTELADISEYGTSWKLGDVVKTVISSGGAEIVQEAAISEVQEAWESGKHTVKPIFGQERTNILKAILKGEIK